MKKLLYYLKPYAGRMTLGLFIKFIGTIVDLLIPWILAYMIDTVVPTRSIFHISLWGGAMVACSVSAIVTNIIANRMASRVAADTTKELRHDLFAKISYLSCRQMDEFTVPSLISRLTSDTYNINQMVGMLQRLGVRAPIMLLGGIIITLTLDPVLALVLIAILPLISLSVYIISKKGIPMYEKTQQSLDKMVRTVRENITGVRIIKALSKTDYEKRRFSRVNAEVADNDKKAGITMAATNPVMNILLNLGLTIVIAVGAYRVNWGLTQPGKIIAFMTYFTIILTAMMSITRIFVLFSKGSASMQRIARVLDAPEDLTPGLPDRKESEYHISFDHVSFSYYKKQDNLTDIHFSLRHGETLGVIGTTGSGKSSIIKLLMRFYEADQGCIRIDGRNVNSIPDEELHTKFGIAFQNDVLFAETVAQNIDFGRGLTEEQVHEAAIHAQASEFIDDLDGAYEYGVAVKGSNLSGGQKQRLLISRALAGSPEILVLDDSFSALDNKTDALLRKALQKNYRNTTTIIIAQRISSILHADRILVLDSGRMAGYGTHDELMKCCEIYRDINRLQMKDEMEDAI